MEQGRLFIAIALSFLIFFLWQTLFVDKEPVQQQKQPLQTDKTQPQTPYITEKEAVPTKTPALLPSQPAAVKLQKSDRIVTVDAPLYQARISENGGVFKSFVLKNYREKVEKDSPLKELVSEGIPSGNIQFGFVGNSLPGMSEAVFSSNLASNRVNVVNNPQSVSFRWKSPQGVVVEKTFLFSPETYLIKLTVTIKNGDNRPIKDNLTVALMGMLSGEKSRFGFEGPSALIGKKVEAIDPEDIKEKNEYTGDLKWIAFQERYFLSGIVPSSPTEASMKLFLGQNNLVKIQYVQPLSTIEPQTQQSFEYALFFGPKSVNILKGIGMGLDKAVNFGWFDFIAKPCLWLMNFLYSFIPNYGVAIIILTIMMKLLLWPLGVKSYKSMSEMKKLQPIMTEIREKYKGDKKRMNEEIMGLYKTYKINPMGGCLPMIGQIPVFFALYRMLYEAIELRHAPFFGWINDLSAPDRLFHFDFSIPFMEPPYGVPVLTLVMGATMFLQQKMTPAPGDPSQAKMMMLMPIFFTFIFINFSSGLVLYWLVNNVLSISQQYYITKKHA